MNQRYSLQNGHSNYENQAILQTINSNSKPWSAEKINHFQPGLPSKTVRNEILKSLTANILRDIFPLMERVFLESGQNIYQPEDVIDYLYFPETAIISDFQILEDGKTVEVAMIGRDGVVGISSVFYSHPSTHWLQVSIPGKAWRIKSKLFQQKIGHCELLQKLLFDYINLYIAQISQKVICNSHHSVEERLCSWFLMISDRCGQNQLRLTQEQIASFLGVHRPSVTLITQSLREKGIIDYLRGKISILDKSKLESSACDCYSTTKIM